LRLLPAIRESSFGQRRGNEEIGRRRLASLRRRLAVAPLVLGVITALALPASATTVGGALQPSVTTIAPTSGPNTGHRYIEVYGSDLSPGGTQCLWYVGDGCTGVTVFVGPNKAFVVSASPDLVLVISPPGAPGIANVTVQVNGQTSAVTPADEYTYSGSQVEIGPATLPEATVGVPYSATLTANAGTAPYTWSLAPGSELPSGLTLAQATGAITGTPNAAGTTDFTVQVTDSTEPIPSTATTQLSIKVLAAPPTVTQILPPEGASSGHRYIEILGNNLTPGWTCLWYRGAGCSGETVYVGANKAFVIYASPTIVLVLSPAGNPGKVSVTVQVDGEASAVTPAATYTYL
jgi:hypothetical protein